MKMASCELTLNSPDQTADFAARLGAQLRPGDTLLLEGEIGAGKTHFARSLIQSLMTMPEDVPSPTFTLVQAYDTEAGEIWHCDLYRLTGPDEIDELGLSEAFETAICLIEWPDKLGPLRPQSALNMTLKTDADTLEKRELTLGWSDPKWAKKLKDFT